MATSNFHSGLRGFLFRSNPVPMFLYDGGSLRIIVANEAARSKYGYSSMEFRSITIRDLHPCCAAPASVSAIPGAHDAESGSLWTHVTKAGKLFSSFVLLPSSIAAAISV